MPPDLSADHENRDESLFPCYVFHGEETFIAEEFIRGLKSRLASGENAGFNLEAFDLRETKWREIIDLARTVPFFFSPSRAIVVRTEAGSKEKLSASDEDILKEYFASPPERTVLVVVISGRADRSMPLLKLLTSLPKEKVVVRESRPLKDWELKKWIAGRFAEKHIQASSQTADRLIEIVGNDLRRIASEIDKLITFAAGRKSVSVDDVDEACGWTKSYAEWELTAGLEAADLKKCLLIVGVLFNDRVGPENIVRILAGFFHDLLAAKVWIRENTLNREEIFGMLRPRIQKNYNFYGQKFREFFSLVDGTSLKALARDLEDLERIDIKIKSTDSSPQVLLEGYLAAYCSRRKKRASGRIILRPRA